MYNTTFSLRATVSFNLLVNIMRMFNTWSFLAYCRWSLHTQYTVSFNTVVVVRMQWFYFSVCCKVDGKAALGENSKPLFSTILIMFFIGFPIFSYIIWPHSTIIGYTKPYAKAITLIIKLYTNHNKLFVKHATY